MSITVPRPRVLQVGKFYPPHMGGIETHLEALCAALRHVLEVRVVAAGDRRGRRDEVRNGVPVARLPTPLHITSAPVCRGLSREIRTSGAELVHLHLPHPAGVLSLLASRYRGPLVVTYHSDVVRQKIMGAVFRPILDVALGRASAIIATSRRYIETSRVLTAWQDRCCVVPYGICVDDAGRVAPSEVQALRGRYGPRMVLAVGRLIYYKGFEHAIRAMTRVDGTLVIVGEGPLREPLGRLAAGLGVDGRVVFAGEIQNASVWPYFHAADVFVLPSVARSEAFGIVQLEAMACGTPVVNTALPSGVPEVSPHGETGLTVPPGDDLALAGAITRLLDDERLRTRLGAAGRRRVAEEFTQTRMAARTLDLYERALPGSGALGRAYREATAGQVVS